MARTQNRLRESDDRSGKDRLRESDDRSEKDCLRESDDRSRKTACGKEMIAAARIACRKMITRMKFRKENKRDETLGRTLHERNQSAGS